MRSTKARTAGLLAAAKKVEADLAFPTRRERATGYSAGVVRGSTGAAMRRLTYTTGGGSGISTGRGRAVKCLAAAAAAIALSDAAPAGAQVESEPGFHLQAQELYQRSLQRGFDQATNLDYQTRWSQLAPHYATVGREDPDRPSDVDPFRLDWGSSRGRQVDVAFTNRYGARMHGHLSLPAATAPAPAILLLTGSERPEHSYRGIQQGLAEAGYVVFGVSVQGDYGSQQHAHDPLPETPQNEYCRDGGNFGGWQDPQELGIVEKGPCAGEPPAGDETPEEMIRFFASQGEDTSALERTYQNFKARKVFGGLDAVAWLLSQENPHRARVDRDRIGIMGHSLGAHGALLAGNGDPLRRFDAVVTLDGYGRLAPSARPRVPTMFQHADGNGLGPHVRRRDAESLPGHLDDKLFRDVGVPSMVVTLGGSTHQEFNYIPYPLSQAPVVLNASRDGERVSLWYALAWFDRWLRHERMSRDDARARLLAPVYDDTVDRSSIGQGPADPVTGRNVPPTISKETAAYHLSPLYRSSAHFDGIRCADLRQGCG